MPDHDTHDLFDFWFFGCKMGEFRWVHQLMDHPWQKAMGPDHRKLMHDARTVTWMETNYGPMAGLVCKGHIALDLSVSSAKKRGMV